MCLKNVETSCSQKKAKSRNNNKVGEKVTLMPVEKVLNGFVANSERSFYWMRKESADVVYSHILLIISSSLGFLLDEDVY